MTYWYLLLYFWHSQSLLTLAVIDLLLLVGFGLISYRVFHPNAKADYTSESLIPLNDDSEEERRLFYRRER